jgi:leucyl-tRNA synthetase
VNKALHAAIQNATDGIEELKFNTPIAKMMELVNACRGELPARHTCEDFLRILSPWAPHLCEELWSRMGHTGSISAEAWPVWDPSALVEDSVNYAVQVGGKLRATLSLPRDASKDDVLAAAKGDESVARHLDGKEIVKEIFVPGKIVNFVVKG